MNKDNNNNKDTDITAVDLPPVEFKPTIRPEPPVGSWASVARIMADIEPDFDWDSWKDEMKESE